MAYDPQTFVYYDSIKRAGRGAILKTSINTFQDFQIWIFKIANLGWNFYKNSFTQSIYSYQINGLYFVMILSQEAVNL